ncbi:hypothetical protein [Bradyrhizobium sp. NP1]|uniref:hypothetical protein n=1 Tax=Bradyrhizobium sp. NP1 TaxID=3049772 RepID=UPI0025A4DCA2|nr:hypothetical protein [Bradyrhizobium sp. NP1]WJR76467.1 hypothetical protein QOU61_27440 [Bradyrhizobium sp. NP1]
MQEAFTRDGHAIRLSARKVLSLRGDQTDLRERPGQQNADNDSRQFSFDAASTPDITAIPALCSKSSSST